MEELGVEFAAAFERVNRAGESCGRIRPLPPSLSTITFTGALNVHTLPVDEMRLTMALYEELGGDPLEFSLDCDVAKRRRRLGAADGEDCPAAASKRFRYQLPLKRNGKSLKLFHNGSVQATGCTSPMEFLEMAGCLSSFIRATADDLEAWLVDFDVQLINALFVVSCPRGGRPMNIAPGALLRRLHPDARADFDTERHPSVKIPVMAPAAPDAPAGAAAVKAATVCVFQTGSVSIMGAKRPAHVAAAYEMVCGVLDACAEEVCAPDASITVRTTTARQPLVLMDGYPSNLYWCCKY